MLFVRIGSEFRFQKFLAVGLTMLSAFELHLTSEEYTDKNLQKMDLQSDLLDEVKRPDNRRAGLKRSAVEIVKDAKNLKTQSKYDKVWTDFITFHNQATVEELNEEMFLQYFDFLINTKQYVHSTLWSVFSMLNSECRSRCGPRLNDYFRLMSLIKFIRKKDMHQNRVQHFPWKRLKPL